jgi:tripartite-type tricarboxylate transporter receptor subunit TctC
VLWSGVAVAVGWAFRDAVNEVLAVFAAAGRWGVVGLLCALALFIAVKAVQRHQLIRSLRMSRVSVDELNTLLAEPTPPLIVDVRSHSSQKRGRIPGAVWIDSHAFDESLRAGGLGDRIGQDSDRLLRLPQRGERRGRREEAHARRLQARAPARRRHRRLDREGLRGRGRGIASRARRRSAGFAPPPRGRTGQPTCNTVAHGRPAPGARHATSRRQDMKTISRFLAALALGSAVATGAFAEAWPAKPVTLLVPFPPGGSTDMIARTVGAKLQESLGGTFIVTNTAGAGGTVGAAAAKRAAPDGYTIFVSSLGPFVIGRTCQDTGYDPLKDFDYITVAVQAPNVLAVPANSPHKSFADVLAFHKANPGKMSFASAGNGTSDHLTAELFWQETRPAACTFPYKGGAPAMSDLLGGQVDATWMNINTGLPNIKAGKLRALAITSSKRSPLLPDVPTMEELGYKGVDGLLVAGVRRAQGAAGRHQDQAARRHRRRAQRPGRQAEAARARLRDRRQHARAVHGVPGERVRALEEGDRGRQDHRRLTAPARAPCEEPRRWPTFPWRGRSSSRCTSATTSRSSPTTAACRPGPCFPRA